MNFKKEAWKPIFASVVLNIIATLSAERDDSLQSRDGGHSGRDRQL